MAGPDRKDDGEDDAALFRAAVGPVRELPAIPEPPGRPRPRPRARMAEYDEALAREDFRLGRGEAFALERGDALSHRQEQVPPRTLKRLSQGLYAAQDELDLHYTDSATAEALLRRFLVESRDAGHGCVRVVHGKGINSTDSLPVLKNVVDRVLRQRADVLAFASAPPAQGGTGAVLVLLARR